MSGSQDKGAASDAGGGAAAIQAADSALTEDYTNPVDTAAALAWPLRILTAMAALFMAGITGLTFVDVTGRYVFNNPIIGGQEMIEFMLGPVLFSALPLVTIKRTHITVELFDGFMSKSFKRVREVVVLIASAGMIAFITERMWTTGLEMLENDDISLQLDVPMAPILFALSALSVVSFVVQIYLIWRVSFIDYRGHAGSAGPPA